MILTDALLASMCAIARDAGAFLLQERARFSRDAVEYKGTNDLVSYVDKETEKRLVAALSQLLPEAGFVTEEGTTGSGSDRAGLNWIIDPLDGTTNFIHGLPIFSVSIGLAEGTRPIAGVIFDPNRDECFFGREGAGAYCARGTASPERIRVSAATQLSDSLIATGFPYYRFEGMPNYLRILEDLMHQTHGLRRMGSAAIDLAYVACGRFEGFFEYNLHAWDIAAGTLLVREAGGVVTDFDGGDSFLYRGDIVAGCGAQSELLATIQKYWR
ncbi:inositol monophosphatase family protein [Rudanella lutea]|uniref:inositol monophosphatase family protein n=1 Tax=Rudanella lutea TaxID=451374 RepID=UPI001B7F7E9E|nr:inositol monophosphatase family protein [Rudanella lutea]